MPELIMLVGLPGTGKSTWVQSHGYFKKPDWMVLSTDNFIESCIIGTNDTYSAVFPSLIRLAERNLMEGLNYACRARMNIVWDQTNLSASSRAKKLKQVPICYKKTARVFPVPSNHSEWLNSEERYGKVIPQNVIDSMHAIFEQPTIYDGFDEIITPYVFRDP
jgi:predicted kinase